MKINSKIFVAKKGETRNHNGEIFGDVIATFDLAVCSPVAALMTEKPATTCFFHCCNAKIKTDMLGKKPTEATPAELIPVLETALNNGADRSRVMPLLMTLKDVEENKALYGDIVVIHYGY